MLTKKSPPTVSFQVKQFSTWLYLAGKLFFSGGHFPMSNGHQQTFSQCTYGVGLRVGHCSCPPWMSLHKVGLITDIPYCPKLNEQSSSSIFA